MRYCTECKRLVDADAEEKCVGCGADLKGAAVQGVMDTPLSEFEGRCRERLAYEASRPDPDRHLIALLIDGARLASSFEWRPIDTAPKDGSFILLAGPSGYTATPLRVEVCRWYPEYRPRDPWQNHGNDSFRDGGEAPTLWMPLPERDE